MTIPPATPAPTASRTLAIAEGIVITGAAAASSPDGKWVAFSGRRSDGSRGPDVWVWRVGSPQAVAITSDGVSQFASWREDSVVVSKTLVGDAPATRDTDPSKVVAKSFLVDPATGASQEIASPAWRPVVDPTDRRVAWWQGTFRWSAAEQSWTPDRGQIVIGDWSALQDGTVNSPEALPWSAPIVDGATWDVRWDPSGRRLAVWISDGPGELSGRLSLFAVQADGSLGAAVVKQAAALAAFSLDAERLAWATPPGKDGAGSTLSVYAWTDNGDGNLRSAPNPDGSIVVAP